MIFIILDTDKSGFQTFLNTALQFEVVLSDRAEKQNLCCL